LKGGPKKDVKKEEKETEKKPNERSLAEEDVWEVEEEKIFINFEWWVESHTAKEIKIQMEFEQPDIVSTVGQDTLFLKIPDLSKFVSAETGEAMNDSAIGNYKSEIQVRIPSIVIPGTA
jgi:hypothetical protein